MVTEETFLLKAVTEVAMFSVDLVRARKYKELENKRLALEWRRADLENQNSIGILM